MSRQRVSRAIVNSVSTPAIPQSAAMLTPPSSTPSGSRQTTADTTVLLTFLCVVSVPNEPCVVDDRAVRSHEEAFRALTEADACRQEHRAFQGRRRRSRCQEYGPRAALLRRRAPARLWHLP